MIPVSLSRALALRNGVALLISYALVSTEEPDAVAQAAALKEVGCEIIFRETALRRTLGPAPTTAAPGTVSRLRRGLDASSQTARPSERLDGVNRVCFISKKRGHS